MKKLVAAFILFLLVSTFVIACTSNPGGSSNGGNAVHMNDTNFVVPSVTITKGSSITLISDTGVAHIISNGKWVNNVSEPATEPGAPVVNNLMFSDAGQSQAIGPFNTAGTFHFYCSVHEGMNLTVIVKGES
jgi:plastocyanin